MLLELLLRPEDAHSWIFSHRAQLILVLLELLFTFHLYSIVVEKKSLLEVLYEKSFQLLREFSVVLVFRHRVLQQQKLLIRYLRH